MSGRGVVKTETFRKELQRAGGKSAGNYSSETGRYVTKYTVEDSEGNVIKFGECDENLRFKGSGVNWATYTIFEQEE